MAFFGILTLVLGMGLWIDQSWGASRMPSEDSDTEGQQALKTYEAMDDLSTYRFSERFIVDQVTEQPAQLLEVPNPLLVREFVYQDDAESLFILDHLGECENLRELSLQNVPANRIADALKHAAGLKSLVFLDLSHLTITIQIFAQAYKLPSLKVMSLCSTKIAPTQSFSQRSILSVIRSGPNILSILDGYSDARFLFLSKFYKDFFRMGPLTENEMNALLSESPTKDENMDCCISSSENILSVEDDNPVVLFPSDSRKSSLHSEKHTHKSRGPFKNCCSIL